MFIPETSPQALRFHDKLMYSVGGIEVAEATAAVNAYLLTQPPERRKLLVIEQIDLVAVRRRGGVWKSVEEVKQNLYGKDRNGDINGREKPGELGELLAVIALYGHIPSVNSILSQYSSVDMPPIQSLVEEMAYEADTDVALPYSKDAAPIDQLRMAIKASIKIADEVADLIYYAHYLRDQEQEEELMRLAEALTGWNAQELCKLAIVKYYIRNEYPDKMAKVNKKQDKKNRKAIEQAVLTQLLCEESEMLLHFELNQAIVPVLAELTAQYRSAQKEQVRFVPHADVVLTDLAGTLVDTSPLFEETYRILAADYNYEWTKDDQEELEARVRVARMKDPLASRQAVFLEMVSGTKPLPHEVDDFQYLRNAQLEHVFQTREIFLQPGVERLMTHQRQTGKKLIVVTGLEPHLVALLKTRIPELEQVPIYTRRPQEDDTVTMQRALADEGCEPSHCTAIFDSAAHVLAALNAGIASGPYPLFYVPSYEKIEAQALSLGHIDTEEAKKVYEAASIADIVIEW